jgi:hypothetical protein
MSPFGKLPVRAQGSNMITVSLTSLSVVCNTSRDNIVNGVKEIFCKFIEMSRAGKMCKLNFGFGQLVAYPNG